MSTVQWLTDAATYCAFLSIIIQDINFIMQYVDTVYNSTVSSWQYKWTGPDNKSEGHK